MRQELHGTRIYLDPASIHAYVLRQNPDIDASRSSCRINNATGSVFATVDDFSKTTEGRAVKVVLREVIDYYGFNVCIATWGDAE